MREQKAGLYLRISREDEKGDLSESIVNQREFLLGYCARHEIKVVEIYQDDGWSGTTFERPGFTRMIGDIEAKKIQMVLTKDLSRLGRDYILTGYYLERYFPLHGIHYVAVNDQIGTQDGNPENDMTPFRAVFNDMYAKDISKKVRTALTTKKQMGRFIGTYAPYGYIKDPLNPHHLLIEETQAVIVREIYRLFLSGESISGIASILMEQGIPTPAAAKHLTSMDRGEVWHYATLRRILSLPTYQGDLTQNTARKVNYKLNKVIKLPSSDWIVVPHTHEGIVTEERFALAQEYLQKRTYRTAGAAKPFTGLIFCGECQAPMTLWSNAKHTYFRCSAWRKNSRNGCTAHTVRAGVVMHVVWETLCTLIAAALKERVSSQIDEHVKAKYAAVPLLEKRKKLAAIQPTLEELKEDLLYGAINQQQYDNLLRGLRGEEERLHKQIAHLDHAVQANIAETWQEKLQDDMVNRGVLLKLISRIVVGNDKKIFVHCRFRSLQL